MSARMRIRLAAATLAMAVMAPSAGGEEFHPLSALNAAVIEWCERAGGVFGLPHVGAPNCQVDEGGTTIIYLGALFATFGETKDPLWWWEQRSGMPDDYTIGVLWYIGPNDPKELCAASRGRLCQCEAAEAAPIWSVSHAVQASPRLRMSAMARF